MALHRDIYWVGKQWAVTGAGLQLIDQKRKAGFDIEIAGLWDEGLLDRIRANAWLDGDDFTKGLSVARRRYPNSQPMAELPASNDQALPINPPTDSTKPVSAKKPLEFRMRIRGVRAKFLPLWRVRTRKLK